MHWADAIRKSNRNTAQRVSKEGEILHRHINGNCVAIKSNGEVREVTGVEKEGFNDWKSIEEKGEKQKDD